MAACGFAAEAAIGFAWMVCAKASERAAMPNFFFLMIIAVMVFRRVEVIGIDAAKVFETTVTFGGTYAVSLADK
jgi:hypothetical protein